MDSLCYPLDVTTTEGDSPAALGNRIAEAVLAYGLTDGSNQADGYAPPDYKPVNPPLVVAQVGDDDDRPEPLAAAPARAHDLAERDPGRERRPAGGRPALGPRHRLRAARRRRTTASRSTRARRRSSATRSTDQAYKDQAVEVIRDSSQLDPADGVTIDISPGRPRQQHARYQRRHAATRSTRRPASRTPPNVVNQGDFGRVP